MYKLVVVELADVVPRRDANKSNLYVGFADAALEGLDHVMSHAKEWARGHEVKLCHELARDTRFTTKKSAKKARVKLVRKLGNQGYTVNRDTTVYRVYVIELDPEGIDHIGRGYLYVGETGKSIEERFEQHRTGARNAAGTVKLAVNVVYKRGICLRHDLIPSGVYFSRKASKEAEVRLAERLRERGYRVEGGH
ncbi:hypothetical protein N8656_00170 [bacterium]|nr:hypothetical protein [bacterium]